jgi:hypothetical protein
VKMKSDVRIEAAFDGFKATRRRQVASATQHWKTGADRRARRGQGETPSDGEHKGENGERVAHLVSQRRSRLGTGVGARATRTGLAPAATIYPVRPCFVAAIGRNPPVASRDKTAPVLANDYYSYLTFYSNSPPRRQRQLFLIA